MKKPFIKDFNLACEQQGISNELPDVSKFRPNMQRKVLAEHKLGIMADANNAIAIENGDAEKDIDPTDDDQYKYMPVFRRIPDASLPLGFRLAFTFSVYAHDSHGPRLPPNVSDRRAFRLHGC